MANPRKKLARGKPPLETRVSMLQGEKGVRTAHGYMCPWCVELLVENTLAGIDTLLTMDGCTCGRPAHIKGVLVLDGNPGRLQSRIAAIVDDALEKRPAADHGPLVRVNTTFSNGQLLVSSLLRQSAWFEFEPMPDDRCEVVTKRERTEWLGRMIEASGMRLDGSDTTLRAA